MSLLSLIFGSSDPGDYAGRESASDRAARKSAARAERSRAASITRHREQGRKVMRDASDRGWR